MDHASARHPSEFVARSSGQEQHAWLQSSVEQGSDGSASAERMSVLYRVSWIIVALVVFSLTAARAQEKMSNASLDQSGVSQRTAALLRNRVLLSAKMSQAQQDVDAVAKQVFLGLRDPIRIATLKADLDGILARDSDLLDATVLTCDEWLRGEVRAPSGTTSLIRDFADQHALVRSIYDPDLARDTMDPYWASAAFTALDRPSLTVRERLIYHGAPRGLLIATLDLQPLLDALMDQAQPDGFVFITIGSKLYTRSASPAEVIDRGSSGSLAAMLAQDSGPAVSGVVDTRRISLAGRSYEMTTLSDAHCCDKVFRLGIATKLASPS